MEDLLSNILIIISCIVGIFILKKFFKIIYNKIFYNMSNQVITIGYLKDFVGDVVKINSSYTDMSYCPTYAELTNGNLVLNFKDNTSPLSIVNGIYVNPKFTSTSTYANNQLVIREHLQLKYAELQSISVSAAKTTISCCGESTTLSATGYFKVVTKSEGGGLETSTTQTSQAVSATYSDSESYTTIDGSKITFSKNSVNYPSTNTAAARTVSVNGSYTYTFNGGKTITKTNTVNITQSANNVGSWVNTSTSTNSIGVSPTSMSFESGGGSKSYSVTRYYTQYQEKYDSCSVVMDTNNYDTSSVVTPTTAVASGDFDCTKTTVSIGINSGALRSGTLTVTYDGKTATCSLSQAASQAGIYNGEPYDYSYDLSVTVASSYVGCDGGTATFQAYYITSWKYDWEEKDASGNVIDSGTSNDSDSINVTNSATWSTDLGSVNKGVLTLGAYSLDARRTATVTASYNGYSDSNTAYQESCYVNTSCMKMSYVTTNLNKTITISYQLTNGTQEGTHSVSQNGTQEMCFGNIGQTTLRAVCNDSEIELSGDVEFTYDYPSNDIKTIYVTQNLPDTYVIDHGGDGNASYSKTFCLNERTLAGHIICSTNGSYVEPELDDIIGIDADGITIDFGTPNGTEVPFYFTLTKKPNQSTITPTFCHPNGGCVFFEITATVNDCNESKTCIKLVHGAQPFCYNQTSYAGGLDFELFEGDNCQSYVESAPTSSIVLITDGEGCNLQGGRIEYESNQTGRIFEYDWIGGENTSANSRYITFIASSTTWNCSGTCTIEQYGTAHTECAPQENCMSYMIGNDTSKSVTIRIYTLNGNYDNSVTVQGYTTTEPYEICDLTDGTKINVSMTSGNGELNMTSFNFKKGEEKVIEVSEITAPTEPTCNTPSGSFAGDYDFRVDFSEAVASDVTVYVDEKDGECNVVNSFEVTVSKGKKTGYGYDVLDQNHNNVVAAYFEITDVSPSSDDTYYYWGNGCEYDDSGNCGGDSGDDTPTDPCVNATVKLGSSNTWGDSDLNSQVVHNICPGNCDVSASGNFYYGFGYMGHNHTFDIDFSIEQVGAIIQTIECSTDSGNHSGEGAFGFTYSGINPDLLLQDDGVMTISGTYTFLDGTGNRQTGTYTVTITIIEV